MKCFCSKMKFRNSAKQRLNDFFSTKSQDYIKISAHSNQPMDKRKILKRRKFGRVMTFISKHG